MDWGRGIKTDRKEEQRGSKNIKNREKQIDIYSPPPPVFFGKRRNILEKLNRQKKLNTESV